MRIAEQIRADSGLGEHLVKTIDVEVVTTVFGARERRPHDPTTGLFQAEEERRVYRRVDDDSPVIRRDRLDDLADARHHVRCREDQVGIGRPAAQTVRGELGERLAKAALVGVAEVAGRKRRPHGVLDRLGRIEVHLGDERRQYVVRVGAPLFTGASAQAGQRAVTQNRIHDVDRTGAWRPRALPDYSDMVLSDTVITRDAPGSVITALQQATHVTLHALGVRLAHLDLTPSEQNVLAVLADGIRPTVGDLAAATGTRPTTLTSVLDRLERRRFSAVSLTPPIAVPSW